MRLIECANGTVAEQPDGFFSDSAIGVFVAIVKNCAHGQWVGHALYSIAPLIENSAAVIISKTFRRPSVR